MKTIARVNHSVIALAMIAVFALVSFVGANGASLQFSQSAAALVPHIFAGIVLAVCVYEVNEWTEHFVSEDK